MKTKDTVLFNRFTFIFALLSAAFLLYNMLAMYVYRDQLFGVSEAVSIVGVVILAGFALVFLFDISSLGWILSQFAINKQNRATGALLLTLIFGGFCLFLLMGAKVMIDEIGREYPIGHGGGEWIILYFLLTIQVIYNIVILMQSHHIHRTTKV